ncbi:MAG: protein kinase [bacterium]|nr:protein kinase [bacterium]
MIFQEKQTLHGGDYEVGKLLHSHKNGEVYAAVNTVTHEDLLLIAYEPPASIEAKELEERVAHFKQIAVMLKSFAHPNIAKFYEHFTKDRIQCVLMEKLDGLPLKRVIEMGHEPIKERRATKWCRQICQALQYLSDRPCPYAYGDVDAESIFIDLNGDAKLGHFSIERFFEQDGDKHQQENFDKVICQEYRQLGSLLYLLLTKTEANPKGIVADEYVNERFAKVINLLLCADLELPYENFIAIDQALSAALEPPVVLVHKKDNKPLFHFIDYRKLWDNAVRSVLGQPVWLLGAEVLGAALICGLLYMLFNPPIRPRTQEACYVACGDEIEIVNTNKMSAIDNVVRMPAQIQALASDKTGVKLYCAAANKNLLYVLNSISNRLVTTVGIRSGVTNMRMDPSNSYLFAIHRKAGLLSVVRLNSSPLPKERVANTRYSEKVENLYSVGHDAVCLDVSSILASTMDKNSGKSDTASSGYGADASEAKGEASQTSASSLPDDKTAYPLVLSTSMIDGCLKAFVYAPGNRFEPVETVCQTPSAVLFDKAQERVYIARKDFADVAVYSFPKLAKLRTFRGIGGTSPLQMEMSSDGKNLWILNASGSVGIVDVKSGKLIDTVKIPGLPVSMAKYVSDKKDTLYVAARGPSRIYKVDPASATVLDKTTLRKEPSALQVLRAPTK